MDELHATAVTPISEIEEKLRQSEERYRLLAENSADIIWTMDMNLRFTYVSPSVKSHRGYTAEEAMALTLEETLPPDSLEKAQNVLAKALANSRRLTPEQLRSTSIVIDLENYCKDGSVIPVESNVSFLLDADGRPAGFIGVSRNTSYRKRMEKELRAAETERRKLSRAVEHSSSAIVVTDKDGIIEYVNPAFSRITGYAAAEVVGKNPRILKSGQHSPEFYQRMWRALLSGEVWQGELINRKKNGELYWEAATITPVKDENDVITHFLALKDDVTERKKLAQQVEEQANLLAVINENVPAVIYQTVIRESEILTRYVSPQITKIFGLEWTDDPAERFLRFVAAIHPEDQARFLMSVREAAANHADWQFEGRFIKPASGETIWFRGQAQPAAENEGLVYTGFLQEITAFKQLEAEREIQHRQRQIINKLLEIGLSDLTLKEQIEYALREIISVPWLPFMPRGGIFLVEDQPETLVLTAKHNLDPALTRLCALVPFGRCLCGRAAQFRQIQFTDCINDDHENLYEGMSPHGHYNVPILRGEEVLGVIVLYLPEGHKQKEDEIRFLQAAANALAGIIGRKRVEEKLRIRRRQAEALQAAAQTLSQFLDLEQTLRQILIELKKIVPHQFATILLLEGDDLVITATHGYPDNTEFIGYSIKYKETENPNRTIIRTGKPLILNDPAEKYPQYYANHPAPEKIRSFMGLPLIIQRRIIGMIVIGWPEPGFYRKSHIRLAEAFVTQAAIALENARLFAEAKQSAEAALRAKQAAEAASRTKSEFLSRVSHELRTPLGSILGYTELFKEGVYGPVTPEQVKTAEKVMESAHYLTKLVDELLEQVQLEAGRINLETISFNLPEMVRRVYDKMDILAQKKKLTLISEIDANVPAIIMGDENRLQQILVNLVNNAIKFTPSGTVKIHVYRPEEERWAMSVSDTGIGIDQEAQAYIFDSFRQVEHVTTREHSGFGLGLSIVKQLTARMGGEVIVDSVLGEGSVFTVLLPLKIP